jgi:hypothetical protein
MKGHSTNSNTRKTSVFLLAGVGIVAFTALVVYPLYIRVLWGLETTGPPAMFFGNDGVCDGNDQLMGDGEDDAVHADAGGWWICWPKEFQPTKDNCKVLSWGIQNVYSFDKAMAKVGCDVHGFDPSPLGLSIKESYDGMGGNYHMYGLGALDDHTYGPGEVPFRWPGMGYMKETNTYPWRLRNIPATMTDVIGTTGKLPNTGGKQLTVLKIDVEGTEWDIMHQLLDVEWDLLMLELHWWPNVHHLLDAGKMRGFVVTNLPNSGVKSAFSRPDIDYMDLWHKITQMGDMYRYHINPRDKKGLCLEVYMIRKKN